MEKTVIRYTTQCDNGTFSVVKKTAKTDRYGSWMQSDEKTVVLASGMPKWNAEYAAAALEYLNHKAQAKDSNSNFDVDSLNCLKENAIGLDELAYHYVSDTLCTGWALHNAYKLTGAPMIDLWLKGSACRFGFLPLDLDRTTVFTTLGDAINKVINAYSLKD